MPSCAKSRVARSRQRCQLDSEFKRNLAGAPGGRRRGGGAAGSESVGPSPSSTEPAASRPGAANRTRLLGPGPARRSIVAAVPSATGIRVFPVGTRIFHAAAADPPLPPRLRPAAAAEGKTRSLGRGGRRAGGGCWRGAAARPRAGSGRLRDDSDGRGRSHLRGGGRPWEGVSLSGRAGSRSAAASVAGGALAPQRRGGRGGAAAAGTCGAAAADARTR